MYKRPFYLPIYFFPYELCHGLPALICLLYGGSLLVLEGCYSRWGTEGREGEWKGL